VHLKDVLRRGEPHDTCAWGEGVVDIEACVRALARLGYRGALAVEHEPRTVTRPRRSERCVGSSRSGCDDSRSSAPAQRRRPLHRRSAPSGKPIAGATDLDGARAEALVAEHGGRATPTWTPCSPTTASTPSST
jgi:hypothetical protein